ncbi:MAG: hypothetical protein ACI8WB_006256, partial [Phenylobacterium sp.]
MKQCSRIFLLMMLLVANGFTAMAGTVSITPQTHSIEGLSGVSGSMVSNNISYQLGAAYRPGDKIEFSFSSNAFTFTGFPTVINIAPVNHSDPNQALAGLTFGLLVSDAQRVVYRVTNITFPHNNASPPVEHQNATTVDMNLPLSAVNYIPSLLLAADLSVTVSSSTTAGDILDSAGVRTGIVAQAKSQFGAATVTQNFDATIDVSKSLNLFTPNAADTFTWAIANVDITGWLNLATVNASNGTTMTLSGGFTGIKDANFTAGGTVSVDDNTGRVSVRFDGSVASDTLTFTPPGDVALQGQFFNTMFERHYVS